MPRIKRLTIPDQKTVYHVMSRTALDKLPFGDVENDELIKIIKRFSALYFTEILGLCAMGNHFHLMVRMIPDHYFSDKEIKKRYEQFYSKQNQKPVKNNQSPETNPPPKKHHLTPEQIPALREKLATLSEFIKEIKQSFSRYYNKSHGRRGTLWGERFKSVIVENGETLINCLAYIDLNPVRAGLVTRPEDYRWNSLGYHIQTNNKDNFLSTDFGLKEFNVKSIKERVRRYRRYVYEAGAINHPEKPQSKTIEQKTLEKERKKDFQLTRIDRFRCRTRYFTDSGIIGTKAYVSSNYQRFKDLFQSKNEKKPKLVKGLDGIYSLKRLAET